MATQLDWYNTFLASKSGQKVYFELRQILTLRFRRKDQEIEPHHALAQCCLDDLAMLISEKCGINTAEAEMQMIGYEATVAATMLEIEKKQPEKTDLQETS